MTRGKPKYGLPDLNKKFEFEFNEIQTQKLGDLGWSETEIKHLELAGRIYMQDLYLIVDAPNASDHQATLEEGSIACQKLLKLLTDANIFSSILIGNSLVNEHAKSLPLDKCGADGLVQELKVLDKVLRDLVGRSDTPRYDKVFIRRKLMFAISQLLPDTEKDLAQARKKSKIYQTASVVFAALKISKKDPSDDIKYVLSNDL